MPTYVIERKFPGGRVEAPTMRHTDTDLRVGDVWDEPGETEPWHVVEISPAEPFAHVLVAPVGWLRLSD